MVAHAASNCSHQRATRSCRRISARTSDDLEIDWQAAFGLPQGIDSRKTAEIDRRRESRQRWRDMHGLATQFKSHGTAFGGAPDGRDIMTSASRRRRSSTA
jgi:hypothetical protein